MGRNTQILEEIVNLLSLTPEHLVHLERHFQDRLILDVGNVDTIISTSGIASAAVPIATAAERRRSFATSRP